MVSPALLPFALYSATALASIVVLRRRRRRGPGPGPGPGPGRSHDEKARVLRMRKKYFCEAQTVSYANSDPLMMMRGEGQYAVDDEGNKFLDSRNNVGHVGWQHPQVVRAIRDQIGKCNANSRYIHPLRIQLAERLCSKLPPQLCKVFFVNSGSEANDLALRLAHAHTGGSDVVVLQRAYHGHTIATIEISPYKYLYKGGVGRQEHIHEIPCPDMYHAESGTTLEALCVPVHDACRSAQSRKGKGGSGLSAFICESGMSVAGVIFPPKGFMQRAYNHIRACHGVCIADEVQTGFGRLGKYYWAFEKEGVVPDIVTIGKPFGNGMPCGAVVTTSAIAESFSNGPEYFNTFGGNPVSCAAAIAVMDIVEKEGMQANAERVGNILINGFRSMCLPKEDLVAFVGDVRGCGLFIGVELVANVQTKEPATAATSILCSRLKTQFNILTSIDGPADNVIVIKPPLCFSAENARYFLGAFLKVLKSLVPGDLARFTHTST
eukprot:g979.t1